MHVTGWTNVHFEVFSATLIVTHLIRCFETPLGSCTHTFMIVQYAPKQVAWAYATLRSVYCIFTVPREVLWSANALAYDACTRRYNLRWPKMRRPNGMRTRRTSLPSLLPLITHSRVCQVAICWWWVRVELKLPSLTALLNSHANEC